MIRPDHRWLHAGKLLALVCLLASPLVSPSLLQAAMIRELRTGDHSSHIRLTVEFDRPIAAPHALAIDGKRVRLSLEGITNLPATPNMPSDMLQLTVLRRFGAIRITAQLAFIPDAVKTFRLTGPQRLIVDLYRPPMEKSNQVAILTPLSLAPLAESWVEPAFILPPASPQPTRIPKYVAPQSTPTPENRKGLTPLQQQLLAAWIVATLILGVIIIGLIRTRGNALRPTKVR